MSQFQKCLIGFAVFFYASFVFAVNTSPLLPEGSFVVAGNQSNDFYIVAKNSPRSDNMDRVDVAPVHPVMNAEMATNKEIKINKPIMAKSAVQKIKIQLERKLLVSAKMNVKHVNTVNRFVHGKAISSRLFVQKKLLYSKKVAYVAKHHLIVHKKMVMKKPLISHKLAKKTSTVHQPIYAAKKIQTKKLGSHLAAKHHVVYQAANKTFRKPIHKFAAQKPIYPAVTFS